MGSKTLGIKHYILVMVVTKTKLPLEKTYFFKLLIFCFEKHKESWV